MPTVIAFECSGGAVVAADSRVVRGGSVASANAERLVSFDDCGVGAVDDPVTVRRELDAAVREYRTDQGRSPRIDPFARLVTDVARDVGTDVAALARDDDGHARVRAVYVDGSVVADDVVALGTGTELALGRLETVEEVAVDEAASLARDVLAGVAERDPQTGGDVDTWTLRDE